MRQAMIYYQDDLAGILVETDDGEYEFTYDRICEEFPARFLTFTMPFQKSIDPTGFFPFLKD